MRSVALLLALLVVAGAGLGGRALARHRAATPLPCGAVVSTVEGDGERLACATELAARCGPVRDGRRYRGCQDIGPMRGALLKLSGLPIDVSTASLDDLTALPGVGPGLAKRIAAARVAGPPLCRLEDLRRVPGLGPKRVRALAGHVAFGDPLCGAVRGQ